MSELQRKKIGDTVKKDVGRLEHSKSLEVILADLEFKE